jgi:signal transduction histidine kinase/ActR/RegA family two-component response regulator
MAQETVLDSRVGFKHINTALAREEFLEKQNIQLQTLLEVGRHLNSTLNLESVLDSIIQVASEVIETEQAAILLLDEETQELRFAAATGLNRATVKSIPVPMEGSIAGWIFNHNKPQIVQDTQQDKRHFNKVDQKAQFRTKSILGVPLQVHDAAIGVLEVVNKCDNRGFDDHDIEMLETLAAHAAVAIENARLYQQLQNQMAALQDAQARLVQSEKLAAIGELIAGVAHELNNPLTTIIGYSELLYSLAEDKETSNDLKRIVTQGQRAATIVRNLLDFSRQRKSERQTVQINSLVQQTLNLVDYDFRNQNITIEADLDPNLPTALADPSQFQQVLVNLLTNARQALAHANKEGRLSITTRRVQVSFDDHPTTNQSVPRPRQDAVRLIVQDNGPGIPAEHLSRIFNPFFTTKGPGEGTGLGLSVCHGIISEHHGNIWAESLPGQGTRFFVELPATSHQPSATPGSSVCPSTAASAPIEIRQDKKDVKVLVVEDEKDLLLLTSRIFHDNGYTVDAVSNGKIARACLLEMDYDVVVCDIRLPGLDGLNLYKTIRVENPKMSHRFIFVTGDIVNRTTQTFLNQNNLVSVSKPFQPADILTQVHHLLSRHEPER